MDNQIPFEKMGTLDELLSRAQAGKAAAGALETIRDQLAAMKEDIYLKLLNAPVDKLVELRADLKAIENLHRRLLARDAQGELAFRQMMAKIPGVEAAPAAVPGKRRSRAKDTTAQ